jgi:hypothetical protein
VNVFQAGWSAARIGVNVYSESSRTSEERLRQLKLSMPKRKEKRNGLPEFGIYLIVGMLKEVEVHSLA